MFLLCYTVCELRDCLETKRGSENEAIKTTERLL